MSHNCSWTFCLHDIHLKVNYEFLWGSTGKEHSRSIQWYCNESLFLVLSLLLTETKLFEGFIKGRAPSKWLGVIKDDLDPVEQRLPQSSFHWYPWPSVNIWSILLTIEYTLSTPQLTLDQHSVESSDNSWLPVIFNEYIRVGQHSTDFWLTVEMLIEYRSRSQLRVLMEGIDIWHLTEMPEVIMNDD